QEPTNLTPRLALPKMRELAPSSSGLGHSPFKAATRVRIPSGSNTNRSSAPTSAYRAQSCKLENDKFHEGAMQAARKRGLAGVQKIMENRERRRQMWRAEAASLWEQWKADPLFVLGVALYWGEGTKSRRDPRFALTNSDADLLSVWMRWCRRFLPN